MRTVEAAYAAEETGAAWIIENPRPWPGAPSLWLYPEVAQLIKATGARWIEFDQCCYGAKATKPEISLVLISTEKIFTALGRVPYGSVRYSNLSLKVGKSAGLRMKLDKASNSLSVSGVYGTNFWGNE